MDSDKRLEMMKIIRSDDFRTWLKGYIRGRKIVNNILVGEIKKMNEDKIEILEFILNKKLKDFEEEQ
jgi:hypothetical protein